MILDTSFIIDLMKNDADAVRKYEHLNEPISITSLSIFELFSGIARCSKEIKEKDKVINAIGGQVILPLNKKAAEKAGEIDGLLAKEGNMISAIDSMIAGIALLKDDKVLTRNVKDFSKIKRLKIEEY